MTPLETKTLELQNVATEYGFTATVRFVGEHTANIHYTPNLSSQLYYTPTGKVKVDTFDKVGRRSDRVALKHIREYLAFYSTKLGH